MNFRISRPFPQVKKHLFSVGTVVALIGALSSAPALASSPDLELLLKRSRARCDAGEKEICLKVAQIYIGRSDYREAQTVLEKNCGNENSWFCELLAESYAQERETVKLRALAVRFCSVDKVSPAACQSQANGRVCYYPDYAVWACGRLAETLWSEKKHEEALRLASEALKHQVFAPGGRYGRNFDSGFNSLASLNVVGMDASVRKAKAAAVKQLCSQKLDDLKTVPHPCVRNATALVEFETSTALQNYLWHCEQARPDGVWLVPAAAEACSALNRDLKRQFSTRKEARANARILVDLFPRDGTPSEKTALRDLADVLPAAARSPELKRILRGGKTGPASGSKRR